MTQMASFQFGCIIGVVAIMVASPAICWLWTLSRPNARYVGTGPVVVIYLCGTISGILALLSLGLLMYAYLHR